MGDASNQLRELPFDSAATAERRQVAQAASHLAAIVESSDDAIVSWSLQADIVSWNSGAEHMYGYAAEEVLGQRAAILLPPNNKDEAPHLIERIKLGERIKHYETVRIRKDGTTIDVSLSVSPIRDQSGELSGVSVVGRDITDSKRAEAELKLARDRALQAERLAEIGEMVAVIAHESRNALQQIQSSLETMRRPGGDGERLVRCIADIQNGQDRLQRLFDDIRGYAAPIVLQQQVCKLNEVWRQVWAEATAAHEGRQLLLTEEIEGLDLHCLVDTFAISRVFRNMFDNSLAATDGPVQVAIRGQTGSLNAPAAVLLTICDDGPGLTAEQRQRVFEPFYSTKSRGTGLGMTIARRLIEAHEGLLVVGSREGRGAEFCITLPRGIA